MKKGAVFEVLTLYVYVIRFDERKDNTLKFMNESQRNYQEIVVEEHISLLEEPGSIYLGYVVLYKDLQKE